MARTDETLRWWPYMALLAGVICIDTSGREVAKGLGLRAQGVRTGSAPEVRLALGYFTLMMITGLGLVVYSLPVLF